MQGLDVELLKGIRVEGTAGTEEPQVCEAPAGSSVHGLRGSEELSLDREAKARQRTGHVLPHLCQCHRPGKQGSSFVLGDSEPRVDGKTLLAIRAPYLYRQP